MNTSEIDLFGDIFVIVLERDTENPIKSRGAIALETHTGMANLLTTIKNAIRHDDGRMGIVTICKLEPIGDLEFCKNLVEQRRKAAQ